MESRTYEQVQYVFTDAEIQHLGEELARENQNLIDLREQKSSALAAITASIKEANQRAAELATKINNRCEWRDLEVCTLMDTPRPGMKTIVPIETPDVKFAIRTEPMTTAERQQSFGFGQGDQ